MKVVKLGKKGQVSIPKTMLQRIGLGEDDVLLVDTTEDGAIILRPSRVLPIEIYSDERVREFLAEDEMSPETAERVEAKLRAMRAQPPDGD